MKIVDLTYDEFNEFTSTHPLRNFCQNSQYAKLMGEKGYSYDYLGYKDDDNNLIGASLILFKKIGLFYKYAYAPKGFLIDYYNNDLLTKFIKDVCDYYKSKNIAFIKINPEIIIGEINPRKGFITKYNQNVRIIDDLKKLGFKRRREINEFDLIFPRISSYIDLEDYNKEKLNKEARELLDISKNSGLILEQATNKEINIFYNFVKDTTYESINYFRNILNSFNNGSSELLLLKIDYEACLINARTKYENELEHNNECNERIQTANNEKNLNEKMQSDRDLLTLKNDIIVATEGLRANKYKYIGGIITIKYQNRISVVACGYDPSFSNLYPSYFIYNELIERYRKEYAFLDLNGLANDFSDNSKYYEFNKSKLDFNPKIYECIGEFDIVLNEYLFNRIQAKGLLSKEFVPAYKNIKKN